MRIMEEYNITGNSSIYKKCHKRKFATCDYCPWNRGENRKTSPVRKGWKNYRKTQYKPK